MRTAVSGLRESMSELIILDFMPEVDPFFSEVRQLVDAKLDGLVPSDATHAQRLYQAIRWSLFGEGKRFRPALVIASGREFGAADETLLGTAAAVEMIHTYSLIHDDLPAMDNDDLRRGRATVHKKFDEATAILAGDALQAMAFETIANDTSLDEHLRLLLISQLATAAGQMVGGQQMDLEAEGRSLSIDQIEQIHKGKTGALIGFSVRAGGMIAHAGPDEMDRLSKFGEKLGLLFQITDDLLDVVESTENLGKTAGKDVAANKATYPKVLGVEKTRELIRNVHDSAMTELSSLDRGENWLAALADFLLARAD
jgi:geranylgeranyl pyrophosphate synthase